MPPLSFNPNIRLVFIYGDPVAATVSIFRRGFQQWQSEKLLRYSRTLAPISRDTTLDEYARQQVDRLLFAEQFHNWRSRYLFYPTLFINYERMWGNLESIFEFLEIPKSEMPNFPSRRPRSSSQADISPDTLEGLNRMYSGFKRELDRIQDIEVLNPKRSASMSMILRKPVYRYAILQQLLDSIHIYISQKRSLKQHPGSCSEEAEQNPGQQEDV